MKLAVIGSRTFQNYAYLTHVLDTRYPNITEIISGGAIGADQLGLDYAVDHGIPVRIWHPMWDVHGKAAGMIRNRDIIRSCEEVVAFWDGHSAGTKNSIELARKMNRPIFVTWEPENE